MTRNDRRNRGKKSALLLCIVLVLSLLALVFGIFPGFIERGIMAVVTEIGL